MDHFPFLNKQNIILTSCFLAAIFVVSFVVGSQRDVPKSFMDMQKVSVSDAVGGRIFPEGFEVSIRSKSAVPILVEDEIASLEDVTAGMPQLVPVKKLVPSKPSIKKEIAYSTPSMRNTRYKGVARVAIIIDDMGLARKWTQAIVDMDAPLTLAFLPYAERLSEFTVPSLKKGHELIIHTPMEPMNPDLDMGSIALHTQLDHEAFMHELEDKVYTSFKGYVGVNNHMGSRLTQDKERMGWLMRSLKERGLFFVDSKTIHTSVAAETARQYGVPYAERDVFLDHYDDYDKIIAALDQMESVARSKGHAIAIGHPRKNTVKALNDWMPGALKRGVTLVPVSKLLNYPQDTLIADKVHQ